MSAAFEVREKYAYGNDCPQSLGVPTWLYGHEPPNAFATHVAKYFANSLREDGLVSLATGGIVFAPGRAGTVQEIFQDGTQNHYATLGLISPMVFLDREYWTRELPVLPLLERLSAGRPYAQMIFAADTVEEVHALLDAHPPSKILANWRRFAPEFEEREEDFDWGDK